MGHQHKVWICLLIEVLTASPCSQQCFTVMVKVEQYGNVSINVCKSVNIVKVAKLFLVQITA